jgi:hypothetical protein
VQKPKALSKPNKKAKRIKKLKSKPPFKVNPYILRVFYILIGPVITYPILDEEGPLRFIGLSLLFSGYHLFMLLFIDLLPLYIGYLQSESPEKEMSSRDLKVTRFFSLSFFVILGCFLGSIKILDHTVHGMPVFWGCIGSGMIIGTALVIRSIKKPFSFISTDNVNGFGIGFPLGTAMLFCSLVFIPNRYIPVKSIENKVVSVSEKSIGSSSRAGRSDPHFLFLKTDDGTTERFTIPEAVYDQIQDSAVCNMHQGIFGLYYIDKIHGL